MSTPPKLSDSERDTEESHVISDQENDESPDENVEELEALIAEEKSKLDEARQKTKMISLKKKLAELQKETLAEQHKRDRETGSGKTESRKVTRKDKKKEISPRDLREFEVLSHDVEKCLSQMGLTSSASAAAADESTSSEDSDDKSSSAERNARKK